MNSDQHVRIWGRTIEKMGRCGGSYGGELDSAHSCLLVGCGAALVDVPLLSGSVEGLGESYEYGNKRNRGESCAAEKGHGQSVSLA